MGHRTGDPRPDQQVNAPPGENARRVRIMRELMSQPKVDIKDSDAVLDRYYWYLDKCEEWDDRPTVEGFALATGYSRMQLYRILHGEVKGTPEAVCYALKRIWEALNHIMAQYMVDGHLNPVTAIFLLKNNFGYKDQTETIVTKKDPYESGNPEEIARKYLAGMPQAIEAPAPAQENAPIVETVIVDQSGKVE